MLKTFCKVWIRLKAKKKSFWNVDFDVDSGCDVSTYFFIFIFGISEWDEESKRPESKRPVQKIFKFYWDLLILFIFTGYSLMKFIATLVNEIFEAIIYNKVVNQSDI